MEDLGKITWSLILMFLSTLAGGFVTMKLWNWLLVPSIEVNDIAYGYGVAIGVFISFIKMRVPTDREGERGISELNESFCKILALYGLYLLIGWIVSLFL